MTVLTTGLVLPLDAEGAGQAEAAGTKAATLSTLVHAGYPVPPGVVLCTRAFELFIEGRGLAPDASPERVAATPLPEEVLAALDEVLARLGDVPLAVRSSAVAEDLPDASFAGQYETVLGVRGTDALREAVGRCWASAFDRRVSDYRRTRGIDGPPRVAVLVQRLVEADAAGVAFSANPVSGDQSESIVNAVRGLGERLVSGKTTPDEWIVRGSEAACRAMPEGAIDAGQAYSIATLARRLEAHFGTPQDIEWAIERGQLFVLQARPVTALGEPPVKPIPIDLKIPPGFWQYDASHHPRPGHHIDLLAFPVIRRASQRWAAEFGYLFDGVEWTEVGMWPYQRMVPLGGRDGGRMPPKWVMWLLVRTLPVLRRRIRQAAEAVRSDKAGRFVERWYAEWQPELNDAIFRHLEVDLASLSDDDLSRHIDSSHDLVERGVEIHMFLAGALAPILYQLVTTCEELLGWDVARSMSLVSGSSYKSTEPARRLHELARMAADRPAVQRLLEHADETTLERLQSADEHFADAFAAYVEAYGRRALGYTLAEPTLAETPWVLLSLVRAQLERGYDPDEDERANARRREQAASEARVVLAGRPHDRARFEAALARAERAYPVREDNEFFTMSAPFAVMRYAVLELGRRLAAQGVIGRGQDVVHLELEQARAALFEGGNYRRVVERRKGERAWAEQHPGPPYYGEPAPPPALDFLPADARLPMESMLWSFSTIMAIEESSGPHSGSGSALRGIAASAGRYSGPVRVLKDETEFGKLQPGDVLVCPITSPVWSVLFPAVGALVTDTGGVLSHPAIIAREYRVPAVVATGNASSVLRDGQYVTVDGTAGLVEVHGG